MAAASKQIVREQLARILARRPENSLPAEDMAGRVIAIVNQHGLRGIEPGKVLARVQSEVRRTLRDAVVTRSPSSLSGRKKSVGLMVHEPRPLSNSRQTFITALHYTILLSPSEVIFVSSACHSGARPHLLERIAERSTRRRTVAEVHSHLSAIWPTLARMRVHRGRGRARKREPAFFSPLGDGLLFGEFQKVNFTGSESTGPVLSVWDASGQINHELNDPFSFAGVRLWAMVKTYVPDELLKPHQRELRNCLRHFAAEYADVVAESDWSWKFGWGERKRELQEIAKTFRLKPPSPDRRSEAFCALEKIAFSDLWSEEAERSAANQRKRELCHSK